MKHSVCTLWVLLSLLINIQPVSSAAPLHLVPFAPPPPLSAESPAAPVKLVFIHHSTGGNWLADPNSDQPYGGLGHALMENNYFVSATNYGWGPDGIGDRTDIPNWPEWFLGPNRDIYLNALYNENGQNVGDFGNWSRMASDPGGKNTIIMFKSCFPNSDLYGDPDDAPLAEPNDYDYTVANTKAVYNAMLTYFETRQDKLFILVTAPPLMRSETAPDRAANARAFNNWLVNEWLATYPYANVAVFDYFNALTDPDNHHRWNSSEIEHIQATNSNYSAYPSGDSHPNTEGHTKATAEFVPLLNVYYNRWQAGGTIAPAPPATEAPTPQEPAEAATPESAPPEPELPAPSSGIIDDFESDMEWYADIGEGATVECSRDSSVAHGGAASLHTVYSIPAGSWGGCGRYFDTIQDWGRNTGLALWLRADEPERWITLALFSGDPDSPTPFEIGLEAPAEWTQIVVPWGDIARAAWADESGLTELDPARITGLGFSLGEGAGNLWVDDVALVIGDIQPPAPIEPDEVEKTAEEESAEPERPTEAPPSEPSANDNEAEKAESGGGLCASAPLALSLVATGLVLGRRRRGSGPLLRSG